MNIRPLWAFLMLSAPPAGAGASRMHAPPRLLSPYACVLSAAAARYGIDSDPYAPNPRSGGSGFVREGVMPANAKRFLGPNLPVSPGAAVAVKIAHESTDDADWALAHEAEVSRRLAASDGEQAFVRSAYDPRVGALVMEDLSRYGNLDDWAYGNGRLGARVIDRIEAQLHQALGTLAQVRLAHSDLSPDNVLVGPRARVKIVDFELAADIGSYAPQWIERRHRGGHEGYLSANQKADGPAALEDDRFAVSAIMTRLRAGRYNGPR